MRHPIGVGGRQSSASPGEETGYVSFNHHLQRYSNALSGSSPLSWRLTGSLIEVHRCLSWHFHCSVVSGNRQVLVWASHLSGPISWEQFVSTSTQWKIVLTRYYTNVCCSQIGGLSHGRSLKYLQFVSSAHSEAWSCNHLIFSSCRCCCQTGSSREDV